jgi:DNA repair protein RecO (recombination protein O)
LVRGKELHRVDQAEVLEHFPAISEDVERLGLAGYFAELLNGFMPEEIPNRPLYHLLVEALRLLGPAEPETLARAFEIRLLTLTGFGPELDHCVACSGSLPPGESSAFSPGAGGVLCPACRRGYGDASTILPGTLQTLRRLREGDLSRVPTVRVSPVIRQELGRVLPEAVAFHLGYRPRAFAFLSQVKKG